MTTNMMNRAEMKDEELNLVNGGAFGWDDFLNFGEKIVTAPVKYVKKKVNEIVDDILEYGRDEIHEFYQDFNGPLDTEM